MTRHERSMGDHGGLQAAADAFGYPREILGDEDIAGQPLGAGETGSEEDGCDIAVHVVAPRWCCSIPALSVERVSYPFPTPSAFEGMLSSIFSKPQIGIEIVSIGVIEPGSPETMTRKELNERTGKELAPVPRVWGGKQRTLRTMTYYRGSEYVVRARIVLRPHVRGVKAETTRKYVEQFHRRLRSGAQYQTPYLGQREFAVEVGPATAGHDARVQRSLTVGPVTLLGAIAYIPQKGGPITFHRKFPAPERRWETPVVEGRAEPIFFDAQIRDGWLRVPEDEVYGRKRRLEGHHPLPDGSWPDLVTPALLRAGAAKRPRADEREGV